MACIQMASPEGRLLVEKQVILAHLRLPNICGSAKGEDTPVEIEKGGKRKTKNWTRGLFGTQATRGLRMRT